ncbi:MAG: M48 family metallopeptidase [Oscillospiraceae bacterium]|nr:M48 family metallopeptidase [Oscillospiraceae bacterium]
MAIRSELYIHESDKAALAALKAIPGFTPLVKGFMKVWSEQQFRIENMSTNLRLSDKQLSKYYNMLPPICEKLGIEVPELYLTLNVKPNAYTYGDTKPFIVITTGLLETVPDELIPTVLAHECGHIACHHVLYSTIGRLLINGTIEALELGGLISLPLQVAFYYWMRCSEYSADRAALICDGTSDKLVEMCMRFAGFDKDIQGEVDVNEFLKQAEEYREMVNGSAWNKTLEFLMYKNNDHPLNAVRAYEAKKWGDSEQFLKAVRYGNLLTEGGAALAQTNEIPIPYGARGVSGLNCNFLVAKLREAGFYNIYTFPSRERFALAKPGRVLSFNVNGYTDFTAGTWFPKDSDISITYYDP